MNALCDGFPTAVAIGGREYAINADFRDCLRIILAFEDGTLTPEEQQCVMLERLYKEIPPNLIEACEMAVLFLNCGESKRSDAAGSGARLYSFQHDADYIWAAFRQTYGIDLETVDFLHWWKFVHLFMNLREDCFFQQMIYLRRKKQKGALTKEEQRAYTDMRDILDLPLTEDEQETADEFMKALKGLV